MEKQLIIGFGTGRSGTTSLSAFLNAQERTSVLHEGRIEPNSPANPFAWEGDEEKVIQWIDGLLENNSGCDWIGDVGMYYINYVDAILDRWPDARFICMQRAQQDVVQSYLKWTSNRNHWMIHDGSQWNLDSIWDKAYPKFCTTDKKDALHQYWTLYTQMTHELEQRLPGFIKVINLPEFNDRRCKESILDFIHYTGVRNAGVRVIENSYKHDKFAVSSKKLRNSFWTVKRKLVGSPGNRWYIKI